MRTWNLGLFAFVLVASIVSTLATTSSDTATATTAGSAYTFDYVVVGGGASGLKLANQLQAYGTVGVIERGTDLHRTKPITDSLYANDIRGRWSTAYMTQQSAVGNRELFPSAGTPTMTINGVVWTDASVTLTSPAASGVYSGGRLLGGSSAVNGELVAEPSTGVQLDWYIASGNNSYWHPQWLANYWNSTIKRYVGGPATSPSVSTESKIHVRKTPIPATQLVDQLAEAYTATTGVPRYPGDVYNAPGASAAGIWGSWDLFQMPDGLRADAVRNFVDPLGLTLEVIADAEASAEVRRLLVPSASVSARGRGLTVLLEATALRLVWAPSANNNNNQQNHEPTVTGVAVLHNGRSLTVSARREVIVCSGLATPELLQRSGVGPSHLLTALGVPVRVANDHVGEHMLNHPGLILVLTAPSDLTQVPSNDTRANYIGGAYWRSRVPSDNAQAHGIQGIIAPAGAPGVVALIASYMQPKSEGRVWIQSTDPFATSLVDNKYMSDPLEADAFVRYIQEDLVPLVNKLHQSNPAYTLVTPPASALVDNTTLRAWVLDNFTNNYHWTSTCRVSRSAATGVVDAVGRVHGTQGLRIADVTILPRITDGNPCIAAYLTAGIVGDAIVSELA